LLFTTRLSAISVLTMLGAAIAAANTGANLDQCQNGRPFSMSNFTVACGTTQQQSWANGDINSQNSSYREGDAIPYRAAITGLTDGTWTIRLQHDFSKAGIYAIDRLTGYYLTQNSSPCAGNGTCTHAFAYPMPAEVPSAGAASPALVNGGNLATFMGVPPGINARLNDIDTLQGVANFSRMMDVWLTSSGSASFVSAGQNWTGQQAGSFNDGYVLQTGPITGDSTREFALVVTVSGCPGNGCSLMLGWSGHISADADWGTGMGAASISGAPFHMRILGVDNAMGTSGGNQDRSTQLGALIDTLTINTVCAPTTDGGNFNLSIGGTAYVNGVSSSNGVACGGTTGVIAVGASTPIAVAETAGSNTSLTNYSVTYSCSNGASGSGSSFSATLAAGATVTCTFTNTVLQPHLTLTDTVVNNNGGSAVASNWTLTATGSTTISGASGSTAVTNAQVVAGTYALSESGPSGYTAGLWSCNGGSQAGNSITLSPGNNVTCTITNTDQPANLTLTATVVNNHGGTSVASDWTVSASGPTPFSGTASVSKSVNAGVYTLTQTGGVAGYLASSWNCNGGVQSGNQVTLSPGQNVTCIITDTDQGPSLTLKNTVSNTHGGTATQGQFSLSASGPSSLSGSGPSVASDTTFKAGTYTLSESSLTGYTQNAWTCDTASVVSGQITLSLGQTAVCTINNSDQGPSLTLKNSVTNAHGGTATADQFTLSATGPTNLSGAGPSVASGATFSAGSYALAESTVTGYNQSAWTCDTATVTNGQITLALGQTTVCSIVNTDKAPSLTLTNTVTNTHGGSAVASQFTLTATGTTTITGSGPSVASTATFSAGTYTLSESTLTGYNQGAWSCDTATVSNGQITMALGQVTVCTIGNTDRAPSLTLTNSVVNTYGGTATAGLFTLTATGPTTLSGAGPSVVSGASFSAGTYTLSESPLFGYTQSAWTCSGATISNGQIVLALGQVASCSIVNHDIDPSLTLVIQLSNTHGGTATPAQFTLSATGNTPISGPGPSVTSGPTLLPGTYTMSLTGPAGYNASAWSCNAGTLVGAQITVSVGQLVTCTIVVTDIPVQVSLSKQVNGGPTTATFTFNEYATLAGQPNGSAVTTLTAPPTATQTVNQAVAFTTCEMNLPAGWQSKWSITITPFSGNATTTTPTAYMWSQDAISANYCYNIVIPQGTQSYAIAVNNLTSGGSPRTIGYWKNWTVCGNANQAQTATKNGGAAAGFYLLENLLPRIVRFGAFTTASAVCAVSVSPTLSTGTAMDVLSKNDTSGGNQGGDAAYALASQLMAARANIWAGAAHSSTVDSAILAGEALLEGLNNGAGFTDSGSYLPSSVKGSLANTRSQALSLASTLDQYNNGLIQ